MPFAIFRKRTLTGANVVGVLIGGSLFSMFFFISLYMQQVLGFSAIEAGLAYLPLAIDDHPLGRIRLTARHQDRLQADPRDRAWCSIAGRAALVQPDLGRRQLPRRRARARRCSPLSASGFAFVPQTIAAVSGVADREAGLASGLINTSQQIGGALGLAVLSTVAFTSIDNAAAEAGGAPSLQALTDGYADAFFAGSAFAVLGLVATLVLIRTRDSRAHVEIGEPSAAQAPIG